MLEELNNLIKLFREEYASAPLYGGFSRTLRRSIPGKQQVQTAFIQNLLMLAKVCDDEEVETKIHNILKKFE
tara:strand:- start:275 stop:490 length:216 start_codon:yes stop_codon:yes gene_type:complete